MYPTSVLEKDRLVRKSADGSVNTHLILMIFALCTHQYSRTIFAYKQLHRPLVYSCLSQLLLSNKRGMKGEENRMEKSLSFELFPVSKSIRRFSLSLMLPKCERFLHRDKQTYEQNAILNHSDEKYSQGE